MRKILVIGAGAAGMAAAIEAAKDDTEVMVLEHNEKTGKKIYITGKGRCNLTNRCERDTFFDAVLSNPKFLYGAYSHCDCHDVMDFFETAGVPLKTERGNRVFPVSDHASDVIRALDSSMKEKHVKVRLHTDVKKLIIRNSAFCGVVTDAGETIPADACIVATGGLSYPSTGSTGDGYRFAKAAGHTVTDTRPGLVPFTSRDAWIPRLMGLSLRNVCVTILDGEKEIYRDFGEMLFTHFGLSGPLILSASSMVGDILRKRELILSIDLKPALSDEQLDRRLIRELSEHANKEFRNAVSSLFPAKMLPIIVERSGIDPYKKANQVTKEERDRFFSWIRNFTVNLTGLRGYNEAIITRGGVSTKEIQPKTMMSKKCRGLFFAGEVLDLDAVTGGFNLQIAWMTGFAAGCGAAEYVRSIDDESNSN